MTELTPSTKDVADLLIRITQLEWPTTEKDRLHDFNTLGLCDEEVLPPRDDDPDSVWFRFTTSLVGQVDGNCSMFRGEFLGLSLFCYNQPMDNGPQARAGYAGLRREVSTALGDPQRTMGVHLRTRLPLANRAADARHVLLPTTRQRHHGRTKPR